MRVLFCNGQRQPISFALLARFLERFRIRPVTQSASPLGQVSNRQLPTLPGRLQPSTIGLCVLNYCVRNGNRWNHASIVTECVRKHLCSLKTIQKKVTEHLRSSRIPTCKAVNVTQSASPFRLASRDVFAYDLFPNRLRLLDRSAAVNVFS